MQTAQKVDQAVAPIPYRNNVIIAESQDFSEFIEKNAKIKK